MAERNNFIDYIRGVAMFLVVFGHSILWSTTDCSNNVLFQSIWTLQIPLFMIVSGYLTRYSKPIKEGAQLLTFIKKRSIAYLLPWFVWMFVVKVGLFDRTDLLNIDKLLWHTDAGYWFLLSIWTINMIFGMSDWLSNKMVGKSDLVKIFQHLAFCGFGMAILSVVALALGVSFFGIKFSLYYIVFYLAGYVYGQVQDTMLSKSYSENMVNYVILISLLIWVALIHRFDFFVAEGNVAIVVLRFVASLTGCIGVIGLLSGIYRVGGVFSWFGSHSLEIYLSHFFFLGIFEWADAPIFLSIEGLAVVAVNLAVTLSATYLVVNLLQKNKLLNFFLFGKR